MIFRAIFWIGLVALLMPRHPDLGLERPGASLPAPAQLAHIGMSGLAQAGSACERHAQACASGFSLLDGFQDKALRGLAEVKAEIDASRKAHAAPEAL